MTLLDAKNYLFKYLEDNHTFDPSKDCDSAFLKSEVISLNGEIDKGLMEKAAQEFTDAKLVIPIEVREKSESGKLYEKTVYVLCKPLFSYEQTVTLSASTISALATVVNTEAQRLKMSDCLVDPLSLSERDIKNVIVIASGASAANTDNEE